MSFLDETDYIPQKDVITGKVESQAVKLTRNPVGGVYRTNNGDHFKIGKANNFEQQLRQVNIELPEKAVEIHRIYTDDPLGIESYWHKRFKSKR